MQRTHANLRRVLAWLDDEPIFWGASQWRDRMLSVCRIAIDSGISENIANAEYEQFVELLDRHMSSAKKLTQFWFVGRIGEPPDSLSPSVERAFFDAAERMESMT